MTVTDDLNPNLSERLWPGLDSKQMAGVTIRFADIASSNQVISRGGMCCVRSLQGPTPTATGKLSLTPKQTGR